MKKSNQYSLFSKKELDKLLVKDSKLHNKIINNLKILLKRFINIFYNG